MKRTRQQYESSLTEELESESLCKRVKIQTHVEPEPNLTLLSVTQQKLEGKNKGCGKCSSVICASYANHFQCLHELLTKPNTQEETRKALICAISQGHVECVRLLLDFNSSDINSEEYKGISPIHMCSGSGHSEVLKELIKRGANVNLLLGTDQIGPLHVSASFGSTECIKLLLENGANLEIQTILSSMNPLHFAAFHGNINCIKIFINYGCNINSTSKSTSRTALHYAAYQGNAECFKFLIENGADPTLNDINGHSPLAYAALNKQGLELFEYFSPLERRNWLKFAFLKVEEKPTNVATKRGAGLLKFFRLFSSIQSESVESAASGDFFKKLPIFQFAFKNEIGEGVGVSREWFSEISKEILNLGIFEFSKSTGDYFISNKPLSPNPILHCISENDLFYFVGCLFGLALVSGHVLPIQLAQPIFKLISSVELSTADVSFIDTSFSCEKTLHIFESYTEENFNDLELFFTTSELVDSKLVEIPLVPNGSNISVTRENYLEYLDALSMHKIYWNREKRINKFVEGFNYIVPSSILLKFKIEDLQTLLGTQSQIAIDDWKSNTKYKKSDEPLIPSVEIQWFWKYVEQLSDALKRDLLCFCTGSPFLPVGGFRQLKSDGVPFTIQLVEHFPTYLPTSRTCFNTLILPRYSSYDVLCDKFNLVLNHQTNGLGFGFV